MLTGIKALLAQALWDCGAIKIDCEDGFELKLHQTQPDAPKSPIYLNLRTKDHPKNPGLLTPEIMELVGDCFAELELTAQVPQRFADIPNAGGPFGDQFQRISQDWDNPPGRLTLEKIIEDDGTRYISGEIEGDYDPGMTCLLVDELITGADTKLEAIGALESNGLTVAGVLLLADRGQGGSELLRAQGYEVFYVFTLQELLSFYLDTQTISQSDYDQIVDYLANN